jgi:hypothetical protein
VTRLNGNRQNNKTEKRKKSANYVPISLLKHRRSLLYHGTSNSACLELIFSILHNWNYMGKGKIDLALFLQISLRKSGICGRIKKEPLTM